MRWFLAFTAILCALCPACGSTPERERRIEPVLYLVNHPSKDAPLGIWCVSAQKGKALSAVPIAPDLDDSSQTFGELLRIGGRYHLTYWRYAASGLADVQGPWLAPLDGCDLGQPRELEGHAVRWSNAAPLYLYGDPEEPLHAGAPGRATVVVDPNGALDVQWSPTRAVAAYTRGRYELRVLDLEGDDPLADLSPIPVATDVVGFEWSADSAFLVLTTYARRSFAWSLARKTLEPLTEEGFGVSDLSVSPDGRFALITGLTSDASVERRLVTLADGSSQPVLQDDHRAGTLEWLAPRPWLQALRSDGSAALYDFSNGAPGSRLDIPAPIELASTAAGEGIMLGADGSARWVRGLPGRADTIGNLSDVTFGSFSPSGKRWAAIDSPVRDDGSLTDHGTGLYIADAASLDRAPIADFGLRGYSIDGVRWIDEDTAALTLIVPGARVVIAVARHVGDGWRVEELSLPGAATGARMLVASADPCTVPSIGPRSLKLPGCAAPYR